ncbi:hypothetical protein PHLCEN_2v12404 [Hermanssonia centrifuga]|uniref:Uncharacterized protein n=1 Tax=Hermanssonia centrifuga TaxID=98765 RepID=A0A2R6NH64_9APHY|nr:hypothetical protein PHLCEN_2v12404 [Hermanssonia centrifuga]
MLNLAEVVIQHAPDALAAIAMHGNVHEGGENHDIPLMEYERVAEFGVGDIPPVRMVEDIVHEDVLQAHNDDKEDEAASDNDGPTPFNFLVREEVEDLEDAERDNLDSTGGNHTIQEPSAAFAAWFGDSDDE